MKLLLVLADDDSSYRALIRNWLKASGEIKVVGEASDGGEAVAKTLTLQPDAVLMDISMPVLNGIEATRQIMAGRPDTMVIGLSIHADKQFKEEMFAAGARAYILKENLVSELLPVLRSLVGEAPPLA